MASGRSVDWLHTHTSDHQLNSCSWQLNKKWCHWQLKLITRIDHLWRIMCGRCIGKYNNNDKVWTLLSVVSDNWDARDDRAMMSMHSLRNSQFVCLMSIDDLHLKYSFEIWVLSFLVFIFPVVKKIAVVSFTLSTITSVVNQTRLTVDHLISSSKKLCFISAM